MNKVILMGRLTRDPEVRYSQSDQAKAVCKYSLAVNRSYKREGEPDADFINMHLELAVSLLVSILKRE